MKKRQGSLTSTPPALFPLDLGCIRICCLSHSCMRPHQRRNEGKCTAARRMAPPGKLRIRSNEKLRDTHSAVTKRRKEAGKRREAVSSLILPALLECYWPDGLGCSFSASILAFPALSRLCAVWVQQILLAQMVSTQVAYFPAPVSSLFAILAHNTQAPPVHLPHSLLSALAALFSCRRPPSRFPPFLNTHLPPPRVFRIPSPGSALPFHVESPSLRNLSTRPRPCQYPALASHCFRWEVSLCFEVSFAVHCAISRWCAP